MWRIEFSKESEKQFNKLDRQTQKEISKYLDKLLKNGNPYDFGKALIDNLSGFWRYRVGKYRLICKIHNDVLLVSILKIDKRDKVYH